MILRHFHSTQTSDKMNSSDSILRPLASLSEPCLDFKGNSFFETGPLAGIFSILLTILFLIRLIITLRARMQFKQQQRNNENLVEIPEIHIDQYAEECRPTGGDIISTSL